ncbi:MAG: mobilization protein [bacterium]|nr:mobilization protein [bacterium]
MPRAKPEELARKQREREARRRAEQERRTARERVAERKRDTRRKILAGALLLDWVERGEIAEKRFLDGLNRFLERDRERALFDLPPRSASTADTEGEQHS